MIQTDFGREPGSYVPVRPKRYAPTYQPPSQVATQIDHYVKSRGWLSGAGVLLRGSYGSRKTTTGLHILHAVSLSGDETPQTYWTESDYLADLRELWSLREQLPRGINDGDLWQDFVSWEHRFEQLKGSPLLFLDNVGQGYSQNHRYEMVNFVRSRKDRGLATIFAVSDQEWGSLHASLQSLLTSDNLVFRVGNDAGR